MPILIQLSSKTTKYKVLCQRLFKRLSIDKHPSEDVSNLLWTQILKIYKHNTTFQLL